MGETLMMIVLVVVAVAAVVALMMTNSRKQARIDALNEDIGALNNTITTLTGEKAALKATVQEREASAEKFRQIQDEALQKAEEQHQKDLEQMEKTFKVLTNENSEVFKQKSATTISEILKPLQEKFERLDAAMKVASKDSIDQSATLKNHIDELIKHSESVGAQAKNLANAITGYSKVQGDFGEMLLTDLLKNAGLTEGEHFSTQSVMTDEAGHEIKSDAGRTLIPDVLVYYPDDTMVVIDSKVTLTSYNQYMNTEDVGLQKQYAQEVVESIRKHVDELKDKDYASYIPAGKTKVNYNIMFIPMEGAFRLMLDVNPRLWQAAKDNNVLIVSQMTLVIVLNMIQMSWKQFDQEKNIEAVYNTVSEMMNQINGWLDSFADVGKNLERAQNAYEASRKKLTGSNQSVVRKISKLEKEYGIVTKRSSRAKLDVSGRKSGPESVIPKELSPMDTDIPEDINDI